MAPSRSGKPPCPLFFLRLPALLWSLAAACAPAFAQTERGLALDGFDDAATAPDSPALDLAPADGSLTVEAHFVIGQAGLPFSGTVVSKPQSFQLEIERRPEGTTFVAMRVWPSPESVETIVRAPVTLSPGRHHIAAIVTRGPETPATVSLFMDGFFLTSAAAPGMGNSDETLFVGGGGGQSFTGWLDAVRISTAARYADAAYSIPETFAPDASTAALWQFNEAATATEFADQSANNIVLTSQGQLTTGPLPASDLPGGLDRTFNPGTGTESDVFPQGVYVMVPQPDGNFLIAGQFKSYHGVARTHLARITADGALDPDFNPVITGGNGVTDVQSVSLQTDGRILIAGRFGAVNGTAREHVARLNADGTLDAAFKPSFTFINNIAWVEALPDGKVLMAGSLLMGEHRDIVRLDAGGSLDRSFQVDVFGFVDRLFRQPDGRFYATGPFSKVNGQARDGLARFNADGSLDATFAPAFNGNGFFPPKSLAVQPDGKILLAGRFTQVNGVVRNGAARLLPNGALDPTFDLAAGPASAVSNGGALDYVAVQPGGWVILSGSFRPQSGTGPSVPRLVRVTGEGALDPAFQAVQFRLAEGVVRAHFQLPDGRILVAGEFTEINGIRRKGLARLNADPGNGPRTTGITRAAVDGSLTITFAGVPGRVYLLEMSSEMLFWEVVRTIEMPESGIFEWSLAPNPVNPHYYYRARQQ